MMPEDQTMSGLNKPKAAHCDIPMATLARVEAFAKGGSARIQR